MIKNYFNDDNTKTGIEGFWYIENDKLIFFVEGSTCFGDWKANLNALPKYSKLSKCWVHRGYYEYSVWLADFIRLTAYNEGFDDLEIIVIGHSMGGGIVQMVGTNLTEATVVSIDGPRTTSKVYPNMRLVFNRGGLVHNLPFWFKRIKNIGVLHSEWRWFWVSHLDYDIDNIIEYCIYGTIGENI